MEAVIDLGTETPIEEIGFNVCVEKGSWIYDARRIDVAVSDDGKHWTTVAERDLPALTEPTPTGCAPHAHLPSLRHALRQGTRRARNTKFPHGTPALPETAPSSLSMKSR